MFRQHFIDVNQAFSKVFTRKFGWKRYFSYLCRDKNGYIDSVTTIPTG